MIPARGGSRGVPRKNVRLLGGKPLICHSIVAALQASLAERVLVITDDDEIAAIAQSMGVSVLREDRTNGLATLDQVAFKAIEALKSLGARDDEIFLTLQPTCPFIRPERITRAVDEIEAGAGSVISVVDDRHLGWRIGEDGLPVPDYLARVNRQQLPPQFRESGAIIGCRISRLLETGTRINQPIRLIEVSKQEAIDIDDFSDWAVAAHLASRRRIVIRADGGKNLGLGHIYRSLAVAQELARHDVILVTDAAHEMGGALLSQYPFHLEVIDGESGFMNLLDTLKPDLVILDQLDTTVSYIRSLRKRVSRIVTFEDLGEGAFECDLLISDLYENIAVPEDRQFKGLMNAIMAPHFETLGAQKIFSDSVEVILLVFGGSDPSHLTEKALVALSEANFKGRVEVVVGPGVDREISLAGLGLSGEIFHNVRFMPDLMRRADLAISSAGRTVTELLSCGVPVLCICQNEKELIHTHAAARFGVINLGLGTLTATETIAAHVDRLVKSPDLRRILHERAKYELAGRSNSNIIARMMRKLGLHDDPINA